MLSTLTIVKMNAIATKKLIEETLMF